MPFFEAISETFDRFLGNLNIFSLRWCVMVQYGVYANGASTFGRQRNTTSGKGSVAWFPVCFGGSSLRRPLFGSLQSQIRPCGISRMRANSNPSVC
jgi:hypothetical protein